MTKQEKKDVSTAASQREKALISAKIVALRDINLIHGAIDLGVL